MKWRAPLRLILLLLFLSTISASGKPSLESYLNKLLGDSFLLTLDGVKPVSLVNTVLIPLSEHAELYQMLNEARQKGQITNPNLGWFMVGNTLGFYNGQAVRGLLKNPQTKASFVSAGFPEVEMPENFIKRLIPYLYSPHRKKTYEDHLLSGLALGFPPDDVAAYALAAVNATDPTKDGRRQVPLLGDRDDSGAVFMKMRQGLKSDVEVERLKHQAAVSQDKLVGIRKHEASVLRIVNDWDSYPRPSRACSFSEFIPQPPTF